VLEPFVKHQPKEGEAAYDISQVQEALIKVLDKITRQEALDTVLIRNVTITAGSSNLIAHKLGRDFIGFYPTRPNAAAKIFEDTSAGADPAVFIALDSDVNVTTDLVVF
jgi:hypothetical protein